MHQCIQLQHSTLPLTTDIEFMGWDAPRGPARTVGRTDVSRTAFLGFADGAPATPGCDGGRFMLGTARSHPDVQHPMFFSSIIHDAPAFGALWRSTKYRTSLHSSSPFFFNTTPASAMLDLQPPNATWRGASQGSGGCGDAQLRVAGPPPAILPLTCAGRMHAYLRDMDGTLWGSPGVVMGQETLPRAVHR